MFLDGQYMKTYIKASSTGWSLVQRSPTVCVYVCDQETPKREAKGLSWTISAWEWINIKVTSVSRQALGPTQPPVQWVPVVLSPGVKRGRGVTLTPQPNLVQRSWMSRSYTSLPQAPPWRVVGLFYFLYKRRLLCFAKLGPTMFHRPTSTACRHITRGDGGTVPSEP
jgi:hypothetical protein